MFVRAKKSLRPWYFSGSEVRLYLPNVERRGLCPGCPSAIFTGAWVAGPPNYH